MVFVQAAIGKGSGDGLYSLLNDDIQTSNNEDKWRYLNSLQATQGSQYRMLMKNLDMLEYMFSDSHSVRLERDILEQLERLGALRLFHSCLSRTLNSSGSFDLSNAPAEIVEDNDSVDNHVNKVVVRSGKKELRKSRRKRTLEKENDTSLQKLPSKTISKDPHQPIFATVKRTLRSRYKRRKIAKTEAEMSTGVKVVSISEMQEVLF